MIYRCYPLGELQANCYVVWDSPDAALVIDPGNEAPRLLAELETLGVTVKAVALTHTHFDHMMAAEALLNATGALLYVPKDDVPALTDPVTSLTTWQPDTPAPVLHPDMTLADGDTFTVGTMTVSVIHTPGHTPGSSCYRVGSLLFTGDTLFAGSMGRTDFPGGDPAAMYRSLHRLMTLPEETAVLPGHGDSSSIGTEKRDNPYLQLPLSFFQAY